MRTVKAAFGHLFPGSLFALEKEPLDRPCRRKSLFVKLDNPGISEGNIFNAVSLLDGSTSHFGKTMTVYVPAEPYELSP